MTTPSYEVVGGDTQVAGSGGTAAASPETPTLTRGKGVEGTGLHGKTTPRQYDLFFHSKVGLVPAAEQPTKGQIWPRGQGYTVIETRTTADGGTP